MNNVIANHNLKLMKNPAPSTTKTCNCSRKTERPMDGNCLSECHIAKHLLSQLLINITMVLVKILSKNVAITINVLSEINLVKRTLNCPSTYGNRKKKILIILLIGILL